MSDIVAMDDRKFREGASSKRMSVHRRRNRTNAVDIYDRNGDVLVRVSLSELKLSRISGIRGRTERGQKYVGFFAPRRPLREKAYPKGGRGFHGISSR